MHVINDGTGTFINTQQAFSRLDVVALGDFDGDGDLDVVMGNRILFNRKDGVFTSGASAFTSSFAGVTLGDVDGDQDLDVIVNADSTNRVWTNDGTGNFTDSQQSLGGQAALNTGGVRDQVWLNLSGDDFADLAVTNSSNRTSVVEGESTAYTVVVSNSGPADVVGASIVNLFSANLEEVALVSVSAAGGASGLVPIGGMADHSFEATVNLPADSSLTFEFTARVASAGQADIASEATVTSSASVSLPAGLRDLTPSDNRAADSDLVELSATRGNATFGPTGQIFGSVSFVGDVVLGDLDGDGDLDAFVVARGPNQVWLNNGAGNFVQSDQIFDDINTTDVALGDFDGDGNLDVFSATNGISRLWVNDGTGTLSLGTSVCQSK